MRSLFLILLLMSCTSWKQNDFEKEMAKDDKSGSQEILIDSKEDKIIEKFQVQSLEIKNKPTTPTIKKIEIKKQISQVKLAEKIIKPLGVTSPYPEDFPDELKAIDIKSKKVWDKYRPNHYENEKNYLDINYLGLTVGKIMIVNKGKKLLNNQEVWHFHARFKSAPFYSNIYELDDTVDTYVSTDKFLSKKYSLIQRESKQDIDDLQLHDRDQLKTFWFYQQKKINGKIKKKKVEKFIPYYSIDPFSVLFLYQGLPLKNGDQYEIPLINKDKVLILKSLVEGREKIQTLKGQKNAIRVHATTNYTGQTLKSGDLYLWFSDDPRRTLLKVQAKIKIGSVTADMVEN